MFIIKDIFFLSTALPPFNKENKVLNKYFFLALLKLLQKLKLYQMMMFSIIMIHGNLTVAKIYRTCY